MGRLFWKILVGFWLTLLVVGAGVGVIVALYDDARTPAVPDEIAGGPRAAVMAASAANALHYGGADALRDLMRDWPRMQERLFAVNAQGTDVLSRPVPEGALARAREVQDSDDRVQRGVRQVDTPSSEHLLVFITQDEPPPPGGRRPQRPSRGPPSNLLWLGGLSSLAFSALLAWYLTRPIRVLRRAFDRVASGALDTRVGAAMGRRRDEIADLGADFDRMAVRLEQLVSSQRQLLHDVSHELRSPLARLQAAIGLARKQPDNIEVTLKRIERESLRLDDLVGELLTLARIEAGPGAAGDEYFDVVGLLETIEEDARVEADAAGVTIDSRIEGEAVIAGRAELIHRALENVVRNALKHSRPGQVVTIAMTREESSVRIRVLDQGPGVPEDRVDHIFEPFVRLDDAQFGTGFGLGLAIALRAVVAHGGAIKASNRHPGLLVEVTLPAVAGA